MDPRRVIDVIGMPCLVIERVEHGPITWQRHNSA